MENSILIKRNEYGQITISSTGVPVPANYNRAWDIINLAEKRGLIPADFIISRSNGIITIADANKNRVAKLAKRLEGWGRVIDALRA